MGLRKNLWLLTILLLSFLIVALESSAQEAEQIQPAQSLEDNGAQGYGEWLYRAETGVTFAANGGRETVAYPGAYRWHGRGAAAASILLYADDFIHTAPNTYPDQALQASGLSYTAHYDGDYAGFENDLSINSWDIVIFANENFLPPTSTFDALNTYVQNGGRLLIHSWLVSNGHPLWSSLDVVFVSNVTTPPEPIYWWSAEHPIFNASRQVPEFTELSEPCNCIYGQRVSWPFGAQALGGYTENTLLNEGGLVVSNRNRTVFRGFLDLHNEADLDGDSVPDGVELWQNLLTFSQPPIEYVAASSTDRVYLLDEDLVSVRSFPAGAQNPNGIATDGKLIYSGHFITDEVIAYDFEGTEQFRWSADLTGLQGMTIIADQLVIAQSANLVFYDPATGTVLRSFPGPSAVTEGLAFDGEQLWLLDNEIIAIDPAAGNMIRTIPNPANPACAFSGTGLAAPDRETLVVACSDGSWFKVATADGTVLDSGDNGLMMFGLKSVPILPVYLPLVVVP